MRVVGIRFESAVAVSAMLAGLVLTPVLILAPVPVQAEDTVTVGGPFTLVAPDRTTVTDATYRDKYLLVFFGYTFCPDTCPMTLSQMALALDRLGPDSDKVQAIFITVDPERDTPEVMGEYTAAFDPRIVGLSGSAEQIAAVQAAYGVYSEKREAMPGDENYLVDHSTYIYIMDRDGKFVRGLDADAPNAEIADVLRDVMARS